MGHDIDKRGFNPDDYQVAAKMGITKPNRTNSSTTVITYVSPMQDRWFYKCQTCGNIGLEYWYDGRPKECGGCDTPDFKLLIKQEPFVVHGKSWVHPLGEV